MAISLSSVLGFYSAKLQAKYQHASLSSVEALGPKTIQFTSLGASVSRITKKEIKKGFYASLEQGGHIAADTSDQGTSGAENPESSNQLSTRNPTSVEPGRGKSHFQTGVNNKTESQTYNDSMNSSGSKQEGTPKLQLTPKRSPLTARERLRAARVLSRYTESKASKSEMGSKVLDALREGDQGKKRSGLPEAPTNLFDDSKRGLPKQGWTFQFPGGSDLFITVFSFVFISTLMFATTYIVWKVGAIHFNEY
uniref:Uncharacterized protein LOC8265374 n=1 Tax=Rhizophora mucronata TaxID=61149 RepID=A0A2P2IVJ2_RHIMU